MFRWAVGPLGVQVDRGARGRCAAVLVVGAHGAGGSSSGGLIDGSCASDRGVCVWQRRGLLASVVAVVLLGVCTSGAWAAGLTAYVANYDVSGTMTVVPIAVATNTPGTAIPVAANPFMIAITPNGSTAYVLANNNTVTQVDLATNTAGPAITVGGSPEAIAITPDGPTAYVASSGAITSYPTFSSGSGSVTPIDLATNTAETPITVGSQLPAIAITPTGAPHAAITSPSAGGGYTVGEQIPTSFSCLEGLYGPGIAHCADSNGAATGSGTLDTTAVGQHTYTVTATSKDYQTTKTSISYTVAPAPAPAATPTPTTPTTPTPTTTTPTTPTPVTPPPGPVVRTQISQVSLTANLVVWCQGHGCRYPSAALRFVLNHATTVRLALRTRVHEHWKQVATTNLRAHRGGNRDRIAGRWHGHLVPVGPVQILVQIQRGHLWTTTTKIRLTVRHTNNSAEQQHRPRPEAVPSQASASSPLRLSTRLLVRDPTGRKQQRPGGSSSRGQHLKFRERRTLGGLAARRPQPSVALRIWSASHCRAGAFQRSCAPAWAPVVRSSTTASRLSCARPW
jgi:hypothetical protein